MLMPVSRPNMRQTQQFSALFRALILPRSGLPTPKSTCGSAKKTLMQQQQRQQQQQNLHASRQLEPEMGGEDSPSTADSRGSRANMSIYGQNFAMPIHPPNFALMTRPSIVSVSGATGASGSEKKQQQQLQGSKAGVEVSQTFAMSFASLNGATAAPGIDLTSMNHAFLQSLPDVARHNYQYMAAQTAQQKENYRVPEEKKNRRRGFL
ncbi:hypothetical protein ACFX2C_044502 [Malus domestica]